MNQLGVWLAALIACVPAMMGNRAAVALLASLLYVKALEAAHVPFDPLVWGLADVCVLAVIVRRNMTLQDKLIAALFVPAWASYFANAVLLYEVTLGVVVAQFLLTVPWLKLQRVLSAVSHGPLRCSRDGDN